MDLSLSLAAITVPLSHLEDFKQGCDDGEFTKETMLVTQDPIFQQQLAKMVRGIF